MEKAKLKSSKELYLGRVKGDLYHFNAGEEKVVPLTDLVWPYIQHGPLEIVKQTSEEEEPETVTEDDANDEDSGGGVDYSVYFENYTKSELKELAESIGVKLDARRTKEDMITSLLDSASREDLEGLVS